MIYKFLVLSILLLIGCTANKGLIPTEDATEVNEIQDDHLFIKDQVDFMDLDKFENLYWVNGNRLMLKDFSNDREYIYENDRLGMIHSIDVSNPQKILVFYDDYDIVVTLDNTLSERSKIDLKLYDFTDINAVGLSNDNNLWLYDPTTFQLKKIDEQGNLIEESLNLNSLEIASLNPNKIVEKENTVFVNSPDDGIFIFDNLGQFIKIVPLKGLKDFQVKKDNIIYANENGAFFYSSLHFDKFQIEALDESRRSDWKQFKLGREHYFIAFANGIQKGDR